MMMQRLFSDMIWWSSALPGPQRPYDLALYFLKQASEQGVEINENLARRLSMIERDIDTDEPLVLVRWDEDQWKWKIWAREIDSDELIDGELTKPFADDWRAWPKPTEADYEIKPKWKVLDYEIEDADEYIYEDGFVLEASGGWLCHVEIGSGPYHKAHVFDPSTKCIYAAELHRDDEGDYYDADDDKMLGARRWCEEMLKEAMKGAVDGQA